MKHLATAAGALAFALLTFFQFPGHTWLQQDSQIYVPILEHLRDPTVLRNEMLAAKPHVAFTLYDEAALALRGLTGLGFREVLAFEQIVTRAFGIWGLLLMAEALGFSMAPALLITAICSLGATIAGPAVLTTEYEPTPRAFAVPLLICAVGLAGNRRYLGAGMVAAAAFLYHPPTALPFWGVYLLLLGARRRFWAMAPLAAAAAILSISALTQMGGGESQIFFGGLTPLQEQLQRMRAGYVWVSAWPATVVVQWIILFAILLAAYARIRSKFPFELGLFLLGLPILGMLSMPVSGLLLEGMGWALVPQVQPMRALLFVGLFTQFLAAAAAVRATQTQRPFEAFVWFALAYLPPFQPQFTASTAPLRLAVIAALAAFTAIALARAPQLAPVIAVAAFFAIPAIGHVVNYPSLHTAELRQLSEWARASTPQDAVFLFPDAAHALYPGIFRSEALRAVYVDWKGGGQVNYLRELGEQWWFRWQQTMASGFKPIDLAKYDGLGITYVVVQPKNRLPQSSAFENPAYVAYRIR